MNTGKSFILEHEYDVDKREIRNSHHLSIDPLMSENYCSTKQISHKLFLQEVKKVSLIL